MCCKTSVSLMTYHRLLEKDYVKIQQNEPTDSCLRKEFANAARTQAETDDKITSLLTQWKKDKQPATDSHFSNMVVDPLITQKADKIRLAIKITVIACILLAIATVTTAAIAYGLYLSAATDHFFVALMQRILSHIIGPSPAFVIPSTVIALFITSGVCAGSGILSYIGYRILDCSSAIREDRIQSDKDFKEFIKDFLEKKLRFFASHEQLTDKGLHSIYSHWRQRMQNQSADVIRLHSNMQLKNAIERTQLEMAT
jgi:hypothetical protein